MSEEYVDWTSARWGAKVTVEITKLLDKWGFYFACLDPSKVQPLSRTTCLACTQGIQNQLSHDCCSDNFDARVWIKLFLSFFFFSNLRLFFYRSLPKSQLKSTKGKSTKPSPYSKIAIPDEPLPPSEESRLVYEGANKNADIDPTELRCFCGFAPREIWSEKHQQMVYSCANKNGNGKKCYMFIWGSDICRPQYFCECKIPYFLSKTEKELPNSTYRCYRKKCPSYTRSDLIHEEWVLWWEEEWGC